MANYISKHSGDQIDEGIDRAISAPVPNHVRNSDFSRLHGFVSGQFPCVDYSDGDYYLATDWHGSWRNSDSSGIKGTQGDGFTTLTSSDSFSAVRLTQHIKTPLAGKTVTVAAKVASSDMFFIGVYCSTSTTTSGTFSLARSFESGYTGIISARGTLPNDATDITFRIYPGYWTTTATPGSLDVYWVALYEGDYSSETLPTYVCENQREDRLKSGAPVHPRNLLDNSYFREYIAQAGLNAERSGWTYPIDRWVVTNPSYWTITGGKQQKLSTTYQYSSFLQRVTGVAGKTLTFAVNGYFYNNTRQAVYNSDISLSVGSRISHKTFTQTGNRIYTITFTVPSDVDMIQCLIQPGCVDGGGTANLYWAALYEGAYTEETLPPYVPKGYATELAECQRYYENSWYPETKSMRIEAHAFVWSANLAMDAIFYYKQTKNRNPTVVFSPAPNSSNGLWQYYLTGWVDFTGVMSSVVGRNERNQLTIRFNKGTDDSAEWPRGEAIQVMGHWEAIADIIE